MTNGIYTLANDVVYEQLVALLNSIEVNVGQDIPVCIIPYDHQLEQVRAEVVRRKNVELLEDAEILETWREFSYQAWSTHPQALQDWQERGKKDKVLASHHRYAAFDPRSPFAKFIYFDSDVLVLNSLEFIFEQLNNYDFVTYDFQYKHPRHVYNLESPQLFEIFPESQIRSEIFCSGCFAAKRGLFPKSQRDWLVQQLAAGEAEILYFNAPVNSSLNYMRMRSKLPICNLALDLPREERTGNSVTSPHFELKDNLLYDKGVRLTYLHYIGLSSQLFTRVCAGEDLDFPYRDIFLYYRYLYEPEKRSQFLR